MQEALDRFMIRRSTLVIAHRFSTIRKADAVAMLQGDAVSEMGGVSLLSSACLPPLSSQHV